MAPKSTTTDAGKAKTKRAPQKRVLHIFYKQTTAEDGSSGVEIVNVMTDARKVLEFVDSPAYAGLKRFKYEIVSTPREDGEEDHSGSASAAE